MMDRISTLSTEVQVLLHVATLPSRPLDLFAIPVFERRDCHVGSPCQCFSLMLKSSLGQVVLKLSFAA